MGTDAENCPQCKAGKLCLKHGSGIHHIGPDGVTKYDPAGIGTGSPEGPTGKPEGVESDGQGDPLSRLGETAALDPDQVKCPRCLAQPGKPCQTRMGRRAQTIHAARKNATRPDHEQTPKPGAKGRRFTSEEASAAAKKAAQSRRRRTSELEALAEQRRVELERQALEDEADRLARDASRYARQRAALKARVLDVATAAFDAAHEALTHIRRTVVDDEGRIVTVVKEITVVDQRTGEKGLEQIEVPDVRGYASPKDAQALMLAAGTSLDKLRLEEDKPTGIHRNERGDGDLVEKLGTEGVEKLLAAAKTLLPPEETS